MTVNLSNGCGVSVKQLIGTFARVTGRPAAYRYVAHCPGIVAARYADINLARTTLDWQAEQISAVCAKAPRAGSR